MSIRYIALCSVFIVVSVTVEFFPVRLIGLPDRQYYVTLPELVTVLSFWVVVAFWSAQFLFRSYRHKAGPYISAMPLPFIDKLVFFAVWGSASVSVFAAAKYVFYNYEIGVMEGNLINTGLAIFVDPSQSYPDPVHSSAIAYMYPPLSSFIAGFLFDAFNHSFSWARGASIVLTLATGGILLRLYRGGENQAENITLFLVWLTVPIFFSAYPYTVRPDAYLVFLVCGSVAFTTSFLQKDNIFLLIAAAVCVGLAMLAKQHAVPVFVMLALTLVFGRRLLSAVVFAGVAILVAGVPLFVLDGATHHWLMKTMLLGKGHRLHLAYIGNMLTDLPMALLIGGAVMYVRGQTMVTLVRNPVFMAFIGSVPLAVLAHAKGGNASYTNYLVPVALALPLLWDRCGIVWRRLVIIAFVVAGPSNLVLRTYAPFHKIAPVSAAAITKLVGDANGPVLLARRQGFLLANGRTPEDDIGDAISEFGQAGIIEPRERIVSNILAGRYAVVASNREHELLGPKVIQYLNQHYDLDTSNHVFEFVFTRKKAGSKSAAGNEN